MIEVSTSRSIGPKKKRRWSRVALEKNLNLTLVHPLSTETGLTTTIILENQDIQVKDGFRSELPDVMILMGRIFMLSSELLRPDWKLPQICLFAFALKKA